MMLNSEDIMRSLASLYQQRFSSPADRVERLADIRHIAIVHSAVSAVTPRGEMETWKWSLQRG